MEVETQLSGGRLWRKSQSKRIEAWDSADGQFRIAQQGSESFLLIAFGRRAEDGDILTRLRTFPLERLRGACREQLDLVVATWPGGVPLTEEAAAKAAELGLDSDWAAEYLLSDLEWAEYERVSQKAYERVNEPSLIEYRRICFRELLRLLIHQ